MKVHVSNNTHSMEAGDSSDNDEVRTVDAVHSPCDELALQHSESSDECDLEKYVHFIHTYEHF